MGNFTMDDLRQAISNIGSSKRTDNKLTIPASDYLWMSDEEFISMCRMKDVEFMGGSEMVNKMKERMKKLNIQ